MKIAFLLASLGIAANADAGVYADAFAKSDKGAIATLRAQKEDAAARCTLGAIYAKKNDLSRASLYLSGCSDLELPTDISETVARASRDVTKKLRESQMSSIVISIEPEGSTLSAELSALPGETFTVPATVWVKGGTYELEATDGQLTYKQRVSVGTFSRTSTVIDVTPKKVAPPKAGKADFREDNAAEATHKGQPAAVKRPSLMRKKDLGIVEGPIGNLEDPMAVRHTRRASSRLWLGARLGAGMFDDGAADARVGGAFGLTTRYALAARYFLAGRLDWSQRGGSSVDAIGASAGAGATIVDSIALIAQLRADLRFGGNDEMDVRTLGASAALNLEFTLPSTPITAGLRFEQGMTEIMPGTRDRAVLLEVGVDWR
ncbi:MAG: hypothetical protein M4D80_21095 [Myxococcota bacterium]|nr:hypothetical protein [Myxococcota bacterium]